MPERVRETVLEVLPWVVLVGGVWAVLIATVLFPLARRVNAWLLRLYAWATEKQPEPLRSFLRPVRTFTEWWVARERLQRLVSLLWGLALLGVWWFVWGARLA